jgi:hypothetical protein
MRLYEFLFIVNLSIGRDHSYSDQNNPFRRHYYIGREIYYKPSNFFPDSLKFPLLDPEFLSLHTHIL